MNQAVAQRLPKNSSTAQGHSTRRKLGVMLLVLLLVAIGVQSGLADRLVVSRFRTLSRQVHTGEWDNQWLGVTLQQYPTDLMVYQNLIWQTRPDLIIETGTNHGGNALFLATLLRLVNPQGRIVTVDIDARNWNRSLETFELPGKNELLDRISFIEGSSTAPEIIEQIKQFLPKNGSVLVILDSDHSKEHVARELELYAPLVNVGGYLIVNDTQWGAPADAVREFLGGTQQFICDPVPGKYLVSCADGGFLRRVQD